MHFDSQGRDLGHALKALFDFRSSGHESRHAHVNARRAANAPTVQIIRLQYLNYRLLYSVHQLADKKASTAQIDQGVDHDLTGSVIRDLPATIRVDDRYRPR